MPAGFITTFNILASIQVWATMRNISAWDVAPKDNLVVAALDVTSEESVENLVKEIIKLEGDSKIFCIIAHLFSNRVKLDLKYFLQNLLSRNQIGNHLDVRPYTDVQ